MRKKDHVAHSLEDSMTGHWDQFDCCDYIIMGPMRM